MDETIQASSGTLAFLKTQGIAIVALLQVWFAWLWKRYAIKGRVENYASGLIEVGYSSFGPTLGVQGTLRALNKDVFVKRIQLRVRKLKNNEEHLFDWVAFRPPKIVLGPSQPQELELPLSFIVTVGQPHRYLIVFNDPQTQGEMRPWLERCREQWNTQVAGAAPGEHPSPAPRVLDVPALAQQYRASQLYINAGDTLARLCYWDPGEYELALIVQSDGKPYSQKLRFNLAQQDFETIRLNVIVMLNSFAGAEGAYHFAYAQLKVV